MKAQKLRENRVKLHAKMTKFIDEHERENGTLSGEDSAIYDKMEAEMNELTAALERQERSEKMDAILNKATSAPLVSKPEATDAVNAEKAGRFSDQYRKDMLTALRTDFRNVSDVLYEGSDANGGYLVPDEYDKRLIEGLEEENIMRALGTRITTSGEHKINIAATKPAASWIEEGGALTFGEATFDQIVLDAHKLHVAIKVTEELLYDSAFNLETYIINAFTKALANAEESAFLTGNGTGKPKGVLLDAETGVTTKYTDKIVADEIIDLVYSLKRPYRKNASFILNDSTLAAVRKLKDGNGVYMWQPALTAGETDRLFGYPVRTSQFAPEIEAASKAIGFGDFSYYNIGDRGTRSMAKLTELFAGNGMVGFVMKERVDGKLVLPEAVKTLKMKEA